MAKLADNITKILAAAGVKLTDEQTAVLAELPQEEVSSTMQTLFDTAANQATSELAKIAAKASNLDKFDEELAGLADILGDNVKTIAKEKGPQKLQKLKAEIAAKIQEAKDAAAAGGGPDLEKLKAEIVTLQQKAQSLEADKAAEVEKVKSEYEGKLFDFNVLAKLQSRKDILEAYSNEDALKMLVLPKIKQYIDGKGLKINPDKLDVVTKEHGTPYIKGAKVVTLDEMFEEALSENKFRQNAGPMPPRTEVETGGSEGPKVTRTSMLRPAVREV